MKKVALTGNWTQASWVTHKCATTTLPSHIYNRSKMFETHLSSCSLYHKKYPALAGIWTPDSWVTSECANHYTIQTHIMLGSHIWYSFSAYTICHFWCSVAAAPSFFCVCAAAAATASAYRVLSYFKSYLLKRMNAFLFKKEPCNKASLNMTFGSILLKLRQPIGIEVSGDTQSQLLH